jgi:predicted acylesterase/phospholipase RssA
MLPKKSPANSKNVEQEEVSDSGKKPDKPASIATLKKDTPAPVKRLKKEEVFYLAFEGGGGKGVTYLGAIKTLESLGLLPIPKLPKKRQIRGVSGTSAGAITALVLALGYTSEDLEGLLKQSEKFKAFFDKPNPGIYRVVDLIKIQDGILSMQGFDSYVDAKLVSARLSRLERIASLIKLLIPKSEDLILKIIQEDLQGYLYNLFYDRGLFPGFAVQDFFESLLREYYYSFDKSIRSKFVKSKSPEMMTFSELYELNKLHLALTGVNVSTKKSQLFSHKTTPDFPVAVAAAISMNVPILFKPVRLVNPYIDLTGTGNKVDEGYWVDGGVQNNLPLHAFDDLEDNPNRDLSRGISGLHKNMLGLRLTPGAPSSNKFRSSNDNYMEQSIDDPLFKIIKAYIIDLLDSFMAPAEEGQIRTPQERIQTIELYTWDLALTDFAPSPEKSKEPIDNAKKAVKQYFENN